MQFLYNELAKEEQIEIINEDYKYIIKVRRAKLNESINLRNLKDDFLYEYKIAQISSKFALLKLKNKIKTEQNLPNLTLAWAVVDPKIIEKTLPFLNEMGISKIAFVYTDFSQKNFKINLKRLERICQSSSSQCGRANLMEFEIYQNTETFLEIYKDVCIIDFSSQKLANFKPKCLFVGAEGGFSKREKQMFLNLSLQKFGLGSNLILRSQTAVLGAIAKILL